MLHDKQPKPGSVCSLLKFSLLFHLGLMFSNELMSLLGCELFRIVLFALNYQQKRDSILYLKLEWEARNEIIHARQSRALTWVCEASESRLFRNPIYVFISSLVLKPSSSQPVPGFRIVGKITTQANSGEERDANWRKKGNSLPCSLGIFSTSSFNVEPLFLTKLTQKNRGFVAVCVKFARVKKNCSVETSRAKTKVHNFTAFGREGGI